MCRTTSMGSGLELSGFCKNLIIQDLTPLIMTPLIIHDPIDYDPIDYNFVPEDLKAGKYNAVIRKIAFDNFCGQLPHYFFGPHLKEVLH